MTIRINVKNEDSRETAIVAVKMLNKDGSEQSTPAKELKGGEAAECLVHDGQSILIKEIRNG